MRDVSKSLRARCASLRRAASTLDAMPPPLSSAPMTPSRTTFAARAACSAGSTMRQTPPPLLSTAILWRVRSAESKSIFMPAKRTSTACTSSGVAPRGYARANHSISSRLVMESP